MLTKFSVKNISAKNYPQKFVVQAVMGHSLAARIFVKFKQYNLKNKDIKNQFVEQMEKHI